MARASHVHASLEEKISIARMSVFLNAPFFGHLLGQMKINIVEDEDEAAVFGDSRTIANVSFQGNISLLRRGFADVSSEVLAGVLIHEVLHPALDYWGRMGDRREIVSFETTMPDGTKKEGRILLWNVAHDLSFNGDIRAMANKTPTIDGSMLVHETRFDGKSAEEIYDILLAEIEAEQSGGGQCAGGGPGDFDQWISQFESDVDDGGNDIAQQWRNMSEDEREWVRRTWQQRVLEAAQVQEQEQGHGSIPGGLQMYVDRLREPRITWGDALARWLGPYGRRAAATFSRRYRKQSAYRDCIMPGFVREGLAEVVVFWDTSGSMHGREADILSEIDGICRTLDVGIRILCIDCAIEADHRDVHSAEEFLRSEGRRQIAGGGGSDFSDGFRLLEEEDYRGVVVAVTDGYITVPREKPDNLIEVLWVLGVGSKHNDEKPASWGETLRLRPDGTAVFEE
jgi:predicted metal-dependent peptidase